MAMKINGVSPFCSDAGTLLGKIEVFSFPPTKATRPTQRQMQKLD